MSLTKLFADYTASDDESVYSSAHSVKSVESPKQKCYHIRGRITMEDLKVVKKDSIVKIQFQNIQPINMSLTNIIDWMSVYNNCISLQKLYISGFRINDKFACQASRQMPSTFMNMISELPFLTKLSICYSNIADQDLDNLGMNPRLRYLDVSGNKCIRSLTFLRSIPQLTSLDVSDTNITDDSLSEVVHTKSLKTFALSETNVSDSIIGSIEELTKLSELDITDTKITEFGYASIMTNCNIDVVYYH